MTLGERDPIVMADTGPLIRLAAAGLLDGLRATNRRVVIVDRVEAEATEDQSKPFAKEIAEWIARNDDFIERPRTVVGAGIEKLESEPNTPEQQRLLKAALRNSGEKAIRDFLEEWAPATQGALVVYEDEDVPRILQSTRVPIQLMTTRRFARQLVDWGINVDAVAAIEEVAKRFTTKPSMSGEIDPEEFAGFSATPAAGRCAMMVARPTFALRPFLIEDAPLLAEIFRASIEELTADDYSEGQQAAWASGADDEEEFARRLGDQLTLIVTMNGSPVGFASLANNETIDLLYVHPAAAGQGAGAMLVDALEKLAGARGAKRLTTEASDSAQDFFKNRGFMATQRNTVMRGGEWLSNTTMEKPLKETAR